MNLNMMRRSVGWVVGLLALAAPHAWCQPHNFDALLTNAGNRLSTASISGVLDMVAGQDALQSKASSKALSDRQRVEP